MDTLIDSCYRRLYDSLLNSHNLCRMFPKLSGQYKIDKDIWKEMVDERNDSAKRLRMWRFGNSPKK